MMLPVLFELPASLSKYGSQQTDSSVGFCFDPRVPVRTPNQFLFATHRSIDLTYTNTNGTRARTTLNSHDKSWALAHRQLLKDHPITHMIPSTGRTFDCRSFYGTYAKAGKSDYILFIQLYSSVDMTIRYKLPVNI